MSRASWYRHGKPAENPEARITQREMAEALNVDARPTQRNLKDNRQALRAKGPSFTEKPLY